MAAPTSALDAIKQIQTILDDEKRSMTDGAHLRLSDAALAAFKEVKALARKKRTRAAGRGDVSLAAGLAASRRISGSSDTPSLAHGGCGCSMPSTSRMVGR